jgi:predicted alpha/beta-hydrolase family hydrolase
MARVSEVRLSVTTPRGDVSAAWARASQPFAALVVGHGAGAGMDHPFLVGFAGAVNDLGVATLRFNFPYVEAGRRSPDPAGTAIASYEAAFQVAVERAGSLPVAVGGKSYGGRIASMALADGMPAAALVFLGYPLHPPGKPERVRDDHLYGIHVPMLFLRGSRDPFSDAAVLDPVLERLGDRAVLQTVEGGGHSFERSRKDDAREVGASLAPIVAAFLRERL